MESSEKTADTISEDNSKELEENSTADNIEQKVEEYEISQAEVQKRRKRSMVIVVIVLAVVVIATLFPLMNMLSLRGETVDVLSVTVEVVEEAGRLYIKSMNASIVEESLLDAPRKDIVMFPGVNAKVRMNDVELAYKSYAEYTGPGIYTLMVVFRDAPEEGDMISIVSNLYPNPSGGYLTDSKSFDMLWTKEDHSSVMNIAYDVVGNQTLLLENATATISTNTPDVQMAVFDGVQAYVTKDGVLVSEVISLPSFAVGSYDADIPLYGEHSSGDELIVHIGAWRLQDVQAHSGFTVVYTWL